MLDTPVISEDGKRIAAQLGNTVWGVLDPRCGLHLNRRLFGHRSDHPRMAGTDTNFTGMTNQELGQPTRG